MPDISKCIAVFGAGSDVGKSVAAAALCRIFSDMGVNVAPFKAQNMSNNSFVTRDGGEMGRAQVVQAECARVEPTVDMNPLLLKPSGNCRSQMILHGKAVREVSSEEFRTDRRVLFAEVMKSLAELRKNFELVIIEGAGSCAEVNLKDYDIANFRTALACGAPVILVADIDRGGVFAQVVGTLGLLDENERKMVKGIIVNRFRGDASLFEDGVEFLKKKTGIDSVWVVPDFGAIEIDSEDSLALDKLTDPQNIVDIDKEKINIAVIRFPHISNFTDFAPLEREPCANLFYMSRVPHEKELEGVDLLILPGTKNVRADLEWLKSSGWAGRIKRYLENGGKVFGICGGYQMLGKEISDPHGVEGKAGCAEGLGLLDIKTVMEESKKLSRIKGKWLSNGLKVSGYEIHMGRTELGADAEPVIELDGGGSMRYEGAHDKKGRVWGSYLHGIFDEGIYSFFPLNSKKNGVAESESQKNQIISAAAYKQTQYDMLAEHFRKHIDIERLIEIAGLKGTHANGR